MECQWILQQYAFMGVCNRLLTCIDDAREEGYCGGVPKLVISSHRLRNPKQRWHTQGAWRDNPMASLFCNVYILLSSLSDAPFVAADFEVTNKATTISVISVSDIGQLSMDLSEVW